MQRSLLHTSIHANHLLVVPTHNVKNSIIKPSAHAYRTIAEVHQDAAQNVLSIQNVLEIKHVPIKNVSILVQIRAVKMLNVES
jgi:rRNA maturation endonuclease Nob1